MLMKIYLITSSSNASCTNSKSNWKYQISEVNDSGIKKICTCGPRSSCGDIFRTIL